MKKRIICIVFAILLSISTVSLVGCQRGEDSSSRVASTASSITTNYADSQGYIEINIDIDKVRDPSVSVDKDKSYVLTSVYEPFLQMSSGLFFSYFKRNGSTSECFDIFTNEQKSVLNGRLVDVKSALDALSREIYIYESSEGELRYKEVVKCYNLAIDRLYNLNFYFADIYFDRIGFDLSSVTSLSSLGYKFNDYLWYLVCLSSRVSFGYEVINYVYYNPFGDMTGWLEKSVYTNECKSILSPIISRLKNTDNLADSLSSVSSTDMLDILKNVRSKENMIRKNYSTFVYAKSLIDMPTYLSFDTESAREAYLDRISSMDRSRFSVVFDFMQGSYSALMSAMEHMSYLVVS